MKSVLKKFDLFPFTISFIKSLFRSFVLAATKVRIVKTRNASDNESVPSAESFLPEKRLALTI